MNTLTTSPVSPVLNRLFAEASDSRPLILSQLSDLSAEERERFMGSKTEYLEFYSRFKEAPLEVSRETGTLLYVLARGCRARSIVEFGTSFGISTLHLASALRDNGGGPRITTEFEPSKVVRARGHLAEAGLLDLVEMREGDALTTLRSGLPGSIDLVLLDGAKALYSDILTLLEGHLRPGALIVADNADHCPEYMARVCSPENGYLSVSFSEDVELSMRLG